MFLWPFTWSTAQVVSHKVLFAHDLFLINKYRVYVGHRMVFRLAYEIILSFDLWSGAHDLSAFVNWFGLAEPKDLDYISR